MPSLPSSPDDGTNFRRSLQIDMKGLVGDAVGNMSISPASRDVVLAARRGLFIIDLEAPLEVPRFLPQGGTWDVADVQWNPHPSRAEYIVSTSSEKLLIWNLLIVGKTSIEHILHSHYRAITDINWHTTECDTVASTGIDSWIWTWDLREPRKPVFGLSAFNESGTQVKWNRQDPNLLASSHASEVLIWDRRKGSLPILAIRAHASKIYGIDWSHSLRNEIVTCSLDHTIKVWDINASPHGTSSFKDLNGSPSQFHIGPNLAASNYDPIDPKTTIRTLYPVWRARNLPFARGVLSLAQRGETALEMYRTDVAFPGFGSDDNKTPTATDPNLHAPVEVFEGHTDVVKEFVWRKGGQDGTDYQLITWSKDRTLRFWPIDLDTMQKVGHVYSPARGRARYPLINDQNISFRDPPEGSEYHPTLSAPIGHRSILAEVRAAPPRARRPDQLSVNHPIPPPRNVNPVLQPHAGSSLRATLHEHFVGPSSPPHSSSALNQSFHPNTHHTHTHNHHHHHELESTNGTRPVLMIPGSLRRSGTMSRGGLGGRSVARMDALAWLSNVKVGGGQQRRSSSSGPGSTTTRDSTSTRNSSSNAPSRVGSKSRPPSRSERKNATAATSVDMDMKDIEESPGIEKVFGLDMDKEKEREREKVKSRRSDSLSRTGTEERRMEESNQSLQDEITTVLSKLSSSKIKLEKHDLTKRRTCTLGLHGPWGESSSVFIRVTFTFPKEYPALPHPEGTPTVEVERSPLISNQSRALILRRLKKIREKRRPCLEACLRFLLFKNEDQNTEPLPLADSESSSDEEHATRKSRDLTVSLLRNNKNLAEPRTSQGTFGPNGELVCFFRAPPRIVRNLAHDLSVSPSKPSSLQETEPRPIQPPALVADAIRRLEQAATVSSLRAPAPKRMEDGGNILRIMTNLLTVSQRRYARDSDSSIVGDSSKNYSYLPPIRRSSVYISQTNDLSGPDRKVALGYIFSADTLMTVCERNSQIARECGRFDHERIFRIMRSVLPTTQSKGCLLAQSFSLNVLMKLYAELLSEKDLQMLAMMAALLLQIRAHSLPANHSNEAHSRNSLSPLSASITGLDYFSMARSISSGNSPMLLPWPRVHSPSIQTTPTQTRGSWSSIFNAGSMRQLMTGSHETTRDSPSPRLDSSTPPLSEKAVPIPPQLDPQSRTPDLPRRIARKDSVVKSPSAISKSWNESTSTASVQTHKTPPSLRLPPPLSKAPSANRVSGEKRLKFTPAPQAKSPHRPSPLYDTQFTEQLFMHVYAYAELLFAWELYERRLELLKCVPSFKGKNVETDGRVCQ
ncbi:hypothetical protein ONZ45_g12696 [Pleurotus djamor]|nr:hypothetical protein ONZ45_g12696 [Pleurotus djamor]